MSNTTKRMIVDNLELCDVFQVVRTDEQGLNNWIAGNSAGFTKEVRTRHPRGEMWSKPLTVTRATGVTWHVRFLVHDYADFKRGGLSFVIYGTFFYRGGMFAVYPMGTPWRECFIFGPHFFQRYNERFLGVPDGSIAGGMEAFFRHNSMFYSTPQPGVPGGVFITADDGTMLGEQAGAVSIVKTFISDTMNKGEQINARETGLDKIVQGKTIRGDRDI